MAFERVKQVLDSFIQEGIPGVDCIITVDHKEVFRYFAGFSNRETGRKIDGSELYLIFSMTKMLMKRFIQQVQQNL